MARASLYKTAMHKMTNSPIPDTVPTTTEHWENRGLPLFYRQWGDPSLPRVLLIHGGQDHGRMWDWTVARLAEKYCFIVPDLRGHGDSGWVPGGGYDILDMLTDIAALIERLAAQGHGEQFDIVGHSLGGNIALHYSAIRPHRVRRLVAIEGLGPDATRYARITKTPPAERYARAVTRRLGAGRARQPYASVDEAFERVRRAHPLLNDDQVRHFTYHALRETEAGWVWKHDPALTMTFHRPMTPEEGMALFGAITCPTLLLYGEKGFGSDPYNDPRVSAIPTARLEVYEGCGHWLHHDAPDRFSADLDAFLQA